jgi:heptosyltransferase-3
MSLQPSDKIAFVMSPRLGDSLLAMVMVNNLVSHGFTVTVFGSYLVALRDWFPWADIRDLPSLAESKQIFSGYDVLLHAYRNDVIAHAESWHSRVVVLDEFASYRQRIAMPDIQVSVCEKQFNLSAPLTRGNGLVVPAGLEFRKYPQRVAIHPTSSELGKNWLPKRFVRLAQLLQKQGFQCAFVVSQKEQTGWAWVRQFDIDLLTFTSLSDLTAWLYESGWFIGNDSGIGHLASNVGIATVTLAMRPSIAKRWCPSWAPAKVVLPSRWLFTKFLKDKFWKYSVSVKRVLRTFSQLH